MSQEQQDTQPQEATQETQPQEAQHEGAHQNGDQQQQHEQQQQQQQQDPASVAVAAAASINEHQGFPKVKGPDAVKLFVGQIPRHKWEADLLPLFQPYGEIFELAVQRSRETGEHKGCAFLTYTTRASADAAIEATHGSAPFAHEEAGQKPLKVQYAIGEYERITGIMGQGTPMSHNLPYTKLFVGRIDRQAEDHEIEALFSNYGKVVEVAILRQPSGDSKGCAFVKYETRAEALLAIDSLNDKHTMRGNHMPLVVKFADTQADKERKRREQYWQQPYPGMHKQMMTPAHFMNRGGYHPTMGGGGGYMGMQMGGQGYVMPGAQGGDVSGGYATGAEHTNPAASAAAAMAGYGQYGAMGGYPAMGGGGGYAPAHPAIGSNQSGPPGANLFLYNLPHETREPELLELFLPFGNVISLKIICDPTTGRSRGFGFVSYDNAESAAMAIQSRNGFNLGGRTIQVSLKREN